MVNKLLPIFCSFVSFFRPCKFSFDFFFLSQVMTVFSALCDEVADLKETAEREFFAPLALFDLPKPGSEDSGSSPEIQIGRMLPLLQVIFFFLRRSFITFIWGPSFVSYIYAKHRHFWYLWSITLKKKLYNRISATLLIAATLLPSIWSNK